MHTSIPLEHDVVNHWTARKQEQTFVNLA